MTVGELVILAATVTGFILAIGLLLIRRSLRKQRVALLLRMGIQTDEEYFWLFPEACRSCGNRTFHEIKESALRESTPGLSPDQVTWVHFVCSRCASTESGDGFGYHSVCYTGAIRTIHSRWLTRVQEEKIPQVRPEQPEA